MAGSLARVRGARRAKFTYLSIFSLIFLPNRCSAVYDGLSTNLPATVMALRNRPFPEGTPLFPRHYQVKDCQSPIPLSTSARQQADRSLSRRADLQSYARDLGYAPRMSPLAQSHPPS